MRADKYDIHGWRVSIKGSSTALLVAAEVIWPNFAEIGGRVYPLVAAQSAEELRNFLVGRVGDRIDHVDPAEAAILGEVDLSVLLPLSLTDDDDTGESAEKLAEILRAAWPAAAGARFPGRHFVAHVEPADEDCGPMIKLEEL